MTSKNNNSNKKSKKWECEYCGKVFDTKKETLKHEKKCKINNPLKYSWKQFGIDMVIALVGLLLLGVGLSLGPVAILVAFALFIWMLKLEKPSKAGLIFALLHLNIFFIIWWAIVKKEKKK